MADIARLRNIAFVGPHHAGKTTLVEAVLAHTAARSAAAARSRKARPSPITSPKTSRTCSRPRSRFAHASADDVDITIVDCPGFVDFFDETKPALCGVDAAVVVVEADPARIVQTQAVVDYLEAGRMPHLFVINKMDRPGADFAGTLAALQSAYGRHVVAEQLPIGNAEQFQRLRRSRRDEGARASTATAKPTTRSRPTCTSARKRRAASCSKRWRISTTTSWKSCSRASSRRSTRSNAIFAPSARTIKSFPSWSRRAHPAPASPRSCARWKSGSRRRPTRRRSMPKGRAIAPDPERPGHRASRQDDDPSAERQTLDRAHALGHAQIRRDAHRRHARR